MSAYPGSGLSSRSGMCRRMMSSENGSRNVSKRSAPGRGCSERNAVNRLGVPADAHCWSAVDLGHSLRSNSMGLKRLSRTQHGKQSYRELPCHCHVRAFEPDLFTQGCAPSLQGAVGLGAGQDVGGGLIEVGPQQLVAVTRNPAQLLISPDWYRRGVRPIQAAAVRPDGKALVSPIAATKASAFK